MWVLFNFWNPPTVANSEPTSASNLLVLHQHQIKGRVFSLRTGPQSHQNKVQASGRGVREELWEVYPELLVHLLLHE